jgi:hypothetical protein
VAIAAYIMFLLAGLGFGYAAPGKLKWLPLLLPLALALGVVLKDGIDGTLVVKLVVALAVTAVGVLLGAVLEQRAERPDRPRYA